MRQILIMIRQKRAVFARAMQSYKLTNFEALKIQKLLFFNVATYLEALAIEFWRQNLLTRLIEPSTTILLSKKPVDV